MTAKELAEILLQDPDREVAFIGSTGLPKVVCKVIKGAFNKEDGYSFDRFDCWLVDDNGVVRKSWLDKFHGEIFPDGNFVHDDTKGG